MKVKRLKEAVAHWVARRKSEEPFRSLDVAVDLGQYPQTVAYHLDRHDGLERLTRGRYRRRATGAKS